MNKTMSKAINAAKLGSSDSTKLVDSSVVAAGIIFWIPIMTKTTTISLKTEIRMSFQKKSYYFGNYAPASMYTLDKVS